MSTREDRWLLPRRQTEYPTWDLVAEETLHGRREGTFLALTSVFLIATAALFVLGGGRIVDLGALIDRVVPDIELPVATQLPFGLVPSALGFAAVMLACELYGRRRAGALLAAGAFTGVALVGLLALSDLDRAENTVASALPFAAYFLAGHLASLLTFQALKASSAGKHFWLRAFLASLVGQLLGWATFGTTMYAVGGTILPFVAAGVAYTSACALALVVPLVIAARALTLFLRVERYDPGFEIINDRSFVRPAQAPILPFSSSELRFFREGERPGVADEASAS